MSNGESLRYEEVTGRELRLVKETMGVSLSKLMADGDLEVAYLLRWLKGRRDDRSLKYDTVLALPLEDVLQGIRDAGEQDPTTAGSGKG